MNIIQFGKFMTSLSPEETIYRLRIDFLFEELVCTRDTAAPSTATLHELHTMIQACGNWMNYHWYDFKYVSKGKLCMAQPQKQIDEAYSGFDKMPLHDSSKVTLKEAFMNFPSITYSYDYGDGWEINILNLGYVEKDSVPRVPYALSGKGDWPPDDVGGEGGFMHLMNVLKDPSNEEYEEMREWMEDLYFEKYSLQQCNRDLSNWEDELDSLS